MKLSLPPISRIYGHRLRLLSDYTRQHSTHADATGYQELAQKLLVSSSTVHVTINTTANTVRSLQQPELRPHSSHFPCTSSTSTSELKRINNKKQSHPYNIINSLIIWQRTRDEAFKPSLLMLQGITYYCIVSPSGLQDFSTEMNTDEQARFVAFGTICGLNA